MMYCREIGPQSGPLKRTLLHRLIPHLGREFGPKSGPLKQLHKRPDACSIRREFGPKSGPLKLAMHPYDRLWI